MYDVPDLGLTPDGEIILDGCGPDPSEGPEWAAMQNLPNKEYEAALQKWTHEIYVPWLDCMDLYYEQSRD